MFMRGNPHTSVGVYLDVKVHKGSRVVYSRRQRAHSFVSNFAKALYGLLYVAHTSSNVISITDTGGASRGYPYLYDQYYPILWVRAPAGAGYFGIKIGSGTTPPSKNDYNLEAPYGTDVFDHYDSYMKYLEYDTYATIMITRTFVNISGASQVVSETGVIARYCYGGGYYANFLILRDLLDPAPTVDPTYAITVQYIIKIVF